MITLSYDEWEFIKTFYRHVRDNMPHLIDVPPPMFTKLSEGRALSFNTIFVQILNRVEKGEFDDL